MNTQPTPRTTPEVQRRATVRPRTDVLETAESLIVIADVPGADPETIELSLTEDVLTLRARSLVQAPEGWRAVGAESGAPDYERSFRLTVEVDRESPKASLHEGRLEIVLAKRLPRSSRIAVQVGD